MSYSNPKFVADRALEAFWGSIKKNYPHVMKGDVDPLVASRLAMLAEEAARDWLSKNDRDAWTRVGTVVKITFLEKVEVGDQEIIAYVWNSDGETFRSWADVRPANWEQRFYRDPNGLDPGLVRLELDGNQWRCATHLHGRPRVSVEAPCEAPLMSAFFSNDGSRLIVSEMICNTEPHLIELSSARMPEDQIREVSLALRWLAAEINMYKYLLSHG